MAAKKSPAGLEAIRPRLQRMGFELAEAGSGRYFVMKYGCAAGIAAGENGEVVVFASPGKVVRGELARLIDRGFQKFLKTADAEVPARAEDLRDLYNFQRDLHYAAGAPMLYNEALGSVSDRYLYDRIWYRDQGTQPRVWVDPRTALPKADLPAAEGFPLSADDSGH